MTIVLDVREEAFVLAWRKGLALDIEQFPTHWKVTVEGRGNVFSVTSGSEVGVWEEVNKKLKEME